MHKTFLECFSWSELIKLRSAAGLKSYKIVRKCIFDKFNSYSLHCQVKSNTSTYLHLPQNNIKEIILNY